MSKKLFQELISALNDAAAFERGEKIILRTVKFPSPQTNAGKPKGVKSDDRCKRLIRWRAHCALGNIAEETSKDFWLTEMNSHGNKTNKKFRESSIP